MLLLIVALLSMMMAGGYAAVLATATATQASNADLKRAWLEGAADRLAEFYEMNAAAIDGQASLPWSNGEEFAQAAGIDLKYRAGLEISSRSSEGDLRYRKLTLWVPNSSSATGSFDPSKALAYEVVSGAAVQRELANQAQLQLTHLSNALVAYYAGQVSADPAHNQAVNYWQSSNCGSRGAGDWSCRSRWTPIDQLADRVIGLTSDFFTNPWGIAVEGQNMGAAVNDENPPYTLALRSRYPWGGAIRSTVVQPIGSS